MGSERYYMIHRGTGLVALAAVCLSALFYGAVTPFGWSMLALFTTLVFTIYVLRGLLVPSSPYPHSPVVAALLYVFALLGCLFLASSFSVAPGYLSTENSVADPGASLPTALRLGMYGMLFLISAAAFNSVRSATAAFKALAIWSTCLAAYGFYALTTGNNPILGALDNGDVVKASFVNRNHYATYAAFGLILNLGVYLSIIRGRAADQPLKRQAREIIERFFGGAWVFALGAVLCAAAVAATGSRAGAMSAVFGVLVFIVAWAGRDRKLSYAGYGFVLLLLAFVIYSSAANLFERFSALDGQEGRFLVYPAVIAGIWDRPFFGHGLGSFPDAFRAYLPLEAARGEWTQAHNSYLENAFEMGLPLASLFYVSILLIVWRVFRATRVMRQDRMSACVGLGCFATAALHSGFDFSLQIPAVASMFAIILGLSWGQSFSEAERKRHRTG